MNSTAFIFDRVSSADQRDGFSLEAQKELSFKYADEKNLKIVRHWSVDESAAVHLDRKHFNEMLSLAQSTNIGHIIFDKIDRAVRNLESAVAIEKLVNAGIKFHFVREHLVIDKESPSHEKMRFYLGLILSTYYIDNLRAEIKKGLDQRKKNGLWNHKAPFAYKNIRDSNDNRAYVVLDEIESPLVKELFNLYASGNYPAERLMYIIKQRIPTRIVTRRLVEHLLSNPFYYGAIPSG